MTIKQATNSLTISSKLEKNTEAQTEEGDELHSKDRCNISSLLHWDWWNGHWSSKFVLLYFMLKNLFQLINTH